MFDVFETYGTRAADVQHLRSLVSQALDVVFDFRVSDYKGEYFLAHGPSGQELTIEPNEREDEDGRYFQEPESSACKTLVRLEYVAPSQVDGEPALDDLSHRLGDLECLILLERNFMPTEN